MAKGSLTQIHTLVFSTPTQWHTRMTPCCAQLFRLGALLPRFRHHVLVESLHSPLETGELHHRVRNLTSPQGTQRFVETVQTLFGVDPRYSLSKSGREGAWKGSLHSYLGRLHGRQSNVGKELSRSRGSQIQTCPPEISVLLTQGIAVQVFEDFIETKFTQTLSRITNSSRGPTKK